MYITTKWRETGLKDCDATIKYNQSNEKRGDIT